MIGCSTNCSQLTAASSTLVVQSNRLQATEWTRVGKEVFQCATGSILRSCLRSCCALASCLASGIATRRSTVQTPVANDRDEETVAHDTATQACCRIRVSSIACPEDLFPQETIELEIRDEAPQTCRSRWPDCWFGMGCMDLTSQKLRYALADYHNCPTRTGGRRCKYARKCLSVVYHSKKTYRGLDSNSDITRATRIPRHTVWCETARRAQWRGCR